MKRRETILIGAVVLVLALLTGAVVLAQESTDVPSSFNDNRINGDIQLGGLAIYCTDETGSTDVNTFQNGGITVWGVGGQQYISLTVAQLRSDTELPEADATEEPAMTEEAPAMAEPTAEATVDASATDEPMMMEPLLLATASTPNGPIWFFRVNEDAFALQGSDETGKFFTYIWEGCGLGSISTTTPAFGEDDMDMMPEATMEATAEATASS